MRPRPKPAVTIHDLFDGTAHCVECAGPCKLPPAELALSNLIRHVFETQAEGRAMIAFSLHELNVDVYKFRNRAMDAVKVWQDATR